MGGCAEQEVGRLRKENALLREAVGGHVSAQVEELRVTGEHFGDGKQPLLEDLLLCFRANDPLHNGQLTWEQLRRILHHGGGNLSDREVEETLACIAQSSGQGRTETSVDYTKLLTWAFNVNELD